jgi:hypothetical protein
MYTMEDLKTNRDAQITVGSILFFVLAFPIYFGIAAGNADTDFAGAAGDYQVSGELTYVVLDSGTESIADGDTWSMTYNTDAVNNADELNIVGVRISMSYGEDETGGKVLFAQEMLPQTPSRAQLLTSHLQRLRRWPKQRRKRSSRCFSDLVQRVHDWSQCFWIVSERNQSSKLIPWAPGLATTPSASPLMPKQETNPLLILVFCQRSDGGETVDYTVEMIVLDYTIEAAQGSSED